MPCRRNVLPGSEASATDGSNPKLALEPSLARQGRSSLGADNGTEESTPDAKAATVPGRRRHCMALFLETTGVCHQLWASGGVDVQAWCSIQFQFLRIVGRIDNHGWMPCCCWPCCCILTCLSYFCHCGVFTITSLRVAMRF